MFAALQLGDGVICSLVRSTDARSRLHSCLHCSAVPETFLHALCLYSDNTLRFYRGELLVSQYASKTAP